LVGRLKGGTHKQNSDVLKMAYMLKRVIVFIVALVVLEIAEGMFSLRKHGLPLTLIH
jgi:hypothetical protein